MPKTNSYPVFYFSEALMRMNKNFLLLSYLCNLSKYRWIAAHRVLSS